jgi:hypothetical protein
MALIPALWARMLRRGTVSRCFLGSYSITKSCLYPVRRIFGGYTILITER